MTGTPRELPLDEWLHTVGFHPADTKPKQLAFGITRQAVANLGALLHGMLPPGVDKGTAYRLLGEFLMYANRALAAGGGPRPPLASPADDLEGSLAYILGALEAEAATLDAALQRDGRYEAQQLVDPPPVAPQGATSAAVDLTHAYREATQGARDIAAAGETILVGRRLERVGEATFTKTWPAGQPEPAYPGDPRDLYEQQHHEEPADAHGIDIPDGTGGHVRVSQGQGYMGLRVLSTTGAAVYRDSDRVSMLLQTISAAGGRAFSDPDAMGQLGE